jgi:hypothetical protein
MDVKAALKRGFALIIATGLLAAQTSHVQKPTFLKTHRVYSANDEMFLQVRVEPDKRIRTVILEAWELESDDPEPQENETFPEWQMPVNPKRGDLIRSSVEDAELDRKIYGFRWKAGLQRGDYHILAKLYLGQGQHVESNPLTVLVR